MRTLSSQEITLIDQRLESLKIQYLEIHHEIRDHYFTKLEKKPAEEFDPTFQQLNETFSWSVVKKMEKNLFKVAGKQIKERQWKMIKFWKADNSNFYITPLAISILLPMYILFDVEGVTLMMGIVGLIGLPISLFASRGEIKIIPKRFTAQFETAFSHQIFSMSGIFLGGTLLIYVAINNWNSSNPGEVGRVLIWFLAIPHVLHFLTLIRISLDWKLKKTT